MAAIQSDRLYLACSLFIRGRIGDFSTQQPATAGYNPPESLADFNIRACHSNTQATDGSGHCPTRWGTCCACDSSGRQ